MNHGVVGLWGYTGLFLFLARLRKSRTRGYAPIYNESGAAKLQLLVIELFFMIFEALNVRCKARGS